MFKRVLFLFLLVSGSVSMAFGMGATEKRNDVDLSIEYDNKGSRSESRHHYLVLNGKAVPDVFEMMEISGIVYRFETRSNNWGDDGYVPVPDTEIPYGQDDRSITADEKQNGWYLSEKRKKDTPDTWCWTIRDGKSAFIDPAKIKDYAVLMGLSDIPRREIPEILRD